LKIVHKRIRPSEEEIQSNPRARSAVLRVIEKI
jgi:16S rRNA C1402 N4-methylase RsmH